MSIYTILNSKSDNLQNSDTEWVLFIQDHRRYILEKCQVITLSNDEINLYDYRPEDFLTSKEYPTSCLWIFLWINQLENTEKFLNMKTLLLPNLAQLYNYRQEYETFKSELNK
jgi:hypothetical protein